MFRAYLVPKRFRVHRINLDAIKHSQLHNAYPVVINFPYRRSISTSNTISNNLASSNPPEAQLLTNAVDASEPEVLINAVDAAAEALVQAPELGYYPNHLVMTFIETVHNLVGVPYWEAIVIATIILRICLLPVAIKTIQSAARMAAVRPEMQKLQDVMNSDPNINDMSVKLRYQKEMQALFVKFKVNPLNALLMPLLQIPLFIAVFTGLRDMGNHFSGFETGGYLWFTNLSAADPYFILPILNSVTFLAMAELGFDGMDKKQTEQMKWGMRALAVAMVPLTATMPQVCSSVPCHYS